MNRIKNEFLSHNQTVENREPNLALFFNPIFAKHAAEIHFNRTRQIDHPDAISLY